MSGSVSVSESVSLRMWIRRECEWERREKKRE